ncbi:MULTISPECIES: TIGR02530 family flagellar biosynthesis protein [Clostridium]|uniref:TIGR02530 family flagellar biosynthesis protein n=1 Tax=Clostridium TaxID=1485 RepID=UPI0018989592|nr:MULTISPECIES: TIGR02530 family flagellar biosynthesis protein [Clostridium]MCR1950177.1 flagellar biosynthesis protein [Clostridium sp. DSM 100503]MDI9219175.1 flagellar biosynthesis protein [Clostridium tertium]
MSFRVINGKAYPVGNFQLPNESVNGKNNHYKSKFNDILNEAINKGSEEYTLSKHAADRLKEINFTDKDMEQIAKGFKMAQDKGSKNSVMIYKDVALIASIENKTVITAIEKERAKENVFTNVDSVVIL